MAKLINLEKKVFGKLTVINKDDANKNGYAVWVCFCECGNTAKVRSRALTTGNTKSCGCGRKEMAHSCKYCGIVFMSNSTRANCCKNAECVGKKEEERKLKLKEYYNENFAKIKDMHKDYYAKNKKQYKESSKKSYEGNRVKRKIMNSYRKSIGDCSNATEKDIVMNSIALSVINRGNHKDIKKVVTERVKYAESRKIFWQ